jgi:NTP pyrophosphatase (non-canonical NTP hydrolase)
MTTDTPTAAISRWHEAVNRAKAAKFGEQPFPERIALALTLLREEGEELDNELVKISSYPGLAWVPAELVENAAKEAADLFFVALQAMFYLGVDFEAVLAEVTRSNWSKLDGGVATFRGDGKLTKGPNYSPADLTTIVRDSLLAAQHLHQEGDQWFWSDETADLIGPYTSAEAAKADLLAYARTL